MGGRHAVEECQFATRFVVWFDIVEPYDGSDGRSSVDTAFFMDEPLTKFSRLAHKADLRSKFRPFEVDSSWPSVGTKARPNFTLPVPPRGNCRVYRLPLQSLALSNPDMVD